MAAHLPTNYIRPLDSVDHARSRKMLAIQAQLSLNDRSIDWSTVPATKGEPHGRDQRRRSFQHSGERYR